MVPSAAARTASRPISAPVGTRMRAPFSLARSIRSPFSQQLRDRERHEDAALVDDADGDVAEQRRRQALDHDVAIVGELGGLAHRDAVANLRQRAPRFFGIAHGDGGKRQAGNAGDQPLGDVEADRAEAGNTQTHQLVCLVVISCGR